MTHPEWTKQPPTVPGFYWVYENDSGEWRLSVAELVWDERGYTYWSRMGSEVEPYVDGWQFWPERIAEPPKPSAP